MAPPRAAAHAASTQPSRHTPAPSQPQSPGRAAPGGHPELCNANTSSHFHILGCLAHEVLHKHTEPENFWVRGNTISPEGTPTPNTDQQILPIMVLSWVGFGFSHLSPNSPLKNPVVAMEIVSSVWVEHSSASQNSLWLPVDTSS